MLHGITAFGEVAIGELPSDLDASVPNPLRVLSTAADSVFTTYCVIAQPYDSQNRNLLIWTDDPTNSSWVKNNSTVTSTTLSDPDGGTNGWSVLCDSVNSEDGIYQDIFSARLVEGNRFSTRFWVQGGGNGTTALDFIIDRGAEVEMSVESAQKLQGSGSITITGGDTVEIRQLNLNTWTEIEVVFVQAWNDGWTNVRFQFFPGGRTTNTGQIRFYRPQLQYRIAAWGSDNLQSTDVRRTEAINGPEGAPGQLVTVRLSNNGYISFPTDAAPNRLFVDALSQPYSATISVISGGRISSRSTPVTGDVEIVNIDGVFDRLLEYDWGGRDVTIYLGQKTSPFDSGFAPIFTGRSDGLSGDLNVMRLQLRSLDVLMESQLQENLYLGIGWALRFDGTNDVVSMGNVLDQDGSADFAFEVLVRSTTADGVLLCKRNSLTAIWAGYSLHINGSGFPVFTLCDGTTEYQATGTASVIDGEWHRISCNYDQSETTVELYVDGELVDTGSTSGMGSTSNSAALRLGETDGGTSDLTGDLSDIRFWSALLTINSLNRYKFRLLTTDEANLVSYWPADEGTGSTLTDNVGSSNGTITGATWIGTGEGGAELAGKPKPLTYGQVTGIEPIVVDPKFLVYQVHDGAVAGIDAVRDQGVELTDAGNVADVWATSVTAGQFATDEASGYFRLGGAPAGELECDVRGDSTGGYVNTIGAIARRIASRHGKITDPTDLNEGSFTTFNAQIPYAMGIHISLDRVFRSDILDQLVEQVMGWWGFDRRGLLTIGLLLDPEEQTATASFNEDQVKLNELVEMPLPPPTWRQEVGYRRQWKTLRHSDLAGSMTAPERAFAVSLLTQEYRYAVSEDEQIRTDYLDSFDERIDTYIATYNDALPEADRRQLLLGSPRRAFVLPVVEGMYSVTVGSVLNLNLPRLLLDEGRRFVVLSIQQSAQENQHEFVVWGGGPN